MAEKRIVTKIAYDTSEVVKGAAAGRAALSSFAETSKTSTAALEREYRNLVSAIDPAEKSQLRFARAVASTNELVKKGRLTQEQANETLRKAEAHYRTQATQVAGLGGIYERFGRQLIGAAAGYKLLQLGREAIGEALEAARAHTVLATVVRSTGGAAGFTADQLDDMASSMSAVVGVDNDVIKGAEAILLRYRGITGEQFPRAIKLGLDMASAQGVQITSTEQLAGSMEKLGKLLGDPARASKMLEREGKSLEEQQLRQIQASLRQNDLAGAQKVLFAELERQYGGTAEALRNEVAGGFQAAEVAWRNLLEEFGKGIILDASGANELADALTDPTLLEAVHDLGAGLGVILKTLVDIGRYAGVVGKLFLRPQSPQYTPVPNFTPTPLNYTPLGSAGAPTPTPPTPPVDPKALAAAEKLRETYARILAEHEETKRVQQELTALYAQAGLTEAKQLAGELKINAEHEERLARQKALVQFADLGAAAAKRMANTLAQINREEAGRAAHLDIQKTKLKDLAAGMEAAHKLAADRAAATWKHALETLEVNLKPVRALVSEIRKLDQDVGFARRVDAITAPTERLRGIEVDYLEFLRRIGGGTVEAGEKVFAEMAVALGETVESIKAKLGELQDRAAIAQVRGAGATPSEIHRGRVAELERLRNLAIDQAVEQGRGVLAIQKDFDAAIRTENEAHWQQVTSEWAAGLSFLGGLFGGFIQQLADSISRIQNAYQQGKQLDASGFGSAAGLSGSFGYIFATAAIFAEVYKAVSLDIKRDRARTWGTVTTQEVVDGQFSSASYVNQAGRDTAFALEQMIRDLVDSLDAVLDDLPQIAIRARRDGKEFSAYVAGVWVGTFRDAQSALEAAVAAAIQQADFAAISEEFAIALRASVGASMDELERNLDAARAARSARLGNVGTQYVEMEDTWRRDMEAARRLGISIADMIRARDREADAIKNNVLGIDTTIADMLHDLGSLQAGMGEAGRSRRAYTEQLIADTRREIAALEQRQRATGVGGGPGVSGGWGGGGAGRQGGAEEGGPSDATDPWSPTGRYFKDLSGQANQSLEELRRQLDQYLQELDKIPTALSDAELNMGIFRALFRDLEHTGKYQEEARKYALMEVEIRYAQIKLELIALGKWEEFASMFDDAYNAAREEAGRARRSGGGGQRQAAREWLDDNAFRLAAERMSDVQRQLAEMNRTYDDQAKELRAGSAEMARLNQQRREEAALIREQGREAAYQALRDYEGQSPFTAERERAEAMRKTFADLLAAGAIGQQRYETALARVNRTLEEHLALLGKQESATLFGQLAQLFDQAGLGDSAQAAALLAEQQRANFVLQVAEARLRYEMLVAEGHLLGRNKDLVEGALVRLEQLDPEKLFTGAPKDGPRFKGYDNVVDAGDRFNKTLEDSRKLFDSYKDARLDQTTRDVQKIQEDFAQIFKDLGRGPDILAEFDAALQATFEELTANIEDVLERLKLGDLSPLSPKERVAEAERRYRELYARAQAGDLEAYREVGAAGEDFLRELRAALATSPGFWDAFLSVQAELEELLKKRPFAKGGIATEASIFGEAGPEAAVPLPDGRSIPVAFAGGGLGSVVGAIDKSGREQSLQLAMLARKVEMQAAELAGLREDFRALSGALARSVALQESELRRRGAAG